jgi:hypothetical protein
VLLDGRTSDDLPDARRDALEVLCAIGELPVGAKEPLLLLARGDGRLRDGALRALGHLADPGDDVLDVLLGAARERGDTAVAAAESLARLLSKPDDVAALVRHFAGRDPSCLAVLAEDPAKVAAACGALAVLADDVERGAPEATPYDVARALDTVAPRSRLARDMHLRNLQVGAVKVWDVEPIEAGTRGDAAFVAPLARNVLETAPLPNGERRCVTARALARLASPEEMARIVAALAGVLDLPDTQEGALRALGDMGTAAREALPCVRALEDHPTLGALARAMRAKIEG